LPRQVHGRSRESAAPTRSEDHCREPSRLPRQASHMPAPPSAVLLNELPRRGRIPPISRRRLYPRRRQRSTPRPRPPGMGPRKPSVGDPRHRRLNRQRRPDPQRHRKAPRPSQRSRPRPQINPRIRARSADSRAVVRRHIDLDRKHSRLPPPKRDRADCARLRAPGARRRYVRCGQPSPRLGRPAAAQSQTDRRVREGVGDGYSQEHCAGFKRRRASYRRSVPRTAQHHLAREVPPFAEVLYRGRDSVERIRSVTA
jgi:hypothetical protein